MVYDFLVFQCVTHESSFSNDYRIVLPELLDCIYRTKAGLDKVKFVEKFAEQGPVW